MWEEKDSFGGRRISGAWSQGMLILRRHLNIQLEMPCMQLSIQVRICWIWG